MTDNKYSVDEILKEIREKKAAKAATETQDAQAAETPPKPADREPERGGDAARPQSSGGVDIDELLARISAQADRAPLAAPPQTQTARSAPAAQRTVNGEYERKAVSSARAAQEIGDDEWEEKAVRQAARQTARSASPSANSDAAEYIAGTRKEPPSARKELKQDRFQQMEQTLYTLRSRRIGSLVAALVCGAAVLLLSLAPTLGLALPSFISPVTSTSVYLWVQVGLVIASALACGDTLGGGMLAVFTARANNDAYTALAVFACLTQGAYLALRTDYYTAKPTMFYLPMAALILVFSAIGRLVDMSRIYDCCRLCGEGAEHGVAMLVEDELLARRLGEGAVSPGATVVAIACAQGLGGFHHQAKSKSRSELISRIACPITAGAALVMALLAYFFNDRNVFTAACVFTAALCIASPMAAGLASALPLSATNKRTAKWQAAYAGYDAVEKFADVGGVIMRCGDLFPAKSVTLHGMKVFNKKPVDKSIIAAASLLSASGSPLAEAFRGMMAGADMMKTPESVVIDSGRGVSGWIDGQRVIAGSRELMAAHGVGLPEEGMEQKYLDSGRRVLFLSCGGELAAMFIVSYAADKKAKRVLSLFAARDIAVLLLSGDPNITAESITEIYGCPAGLVKLISEQQYKDAAEGRLSGAVAPAELIHSGEPASYARALATARGCRSSVTTESALLLISIVVGFGLITFLSFTGAIGSVTWMALAVYQGFWALIEIIVPLLHK